MTTISVSLHEDDPDVLDRQARLLRDDLRSLDADVGFASGPPAPADAKGDRRVSGTIVVTNAASPALAELGRVLQDFVDRGPRTVVVTEGDRRLEIKAPLDDAAKRAVTEFFREEIG